MDQDLGWWTHVALGGWRERPGPLYQRLAASVLDAVDEGRLRPGLRLPAERLLADGLGISRGTVVLAFDQLTKAGVVRRRQGAGTFVVGRPGWMRQPADNPTAALLLRRLAGGESIDLSLSVPPDTDHLAGLGWGDAVTLGAAHHGLDPLGLPTLRQRIASHLSEHQQLPTDADQIVVTAGAQQALALLAAVVSSRRSTVVAGCPTYPGLASAFAGRPARLTPVAADGTAGADPDAIGRAARTGDNAVVYVMSTGTNPTGTVIPAARRRAILEAAHAGGALVIEDLSLADLVLDDNDVPPPLAAMEPTVVAVGSVSKLFWAGLRVGWIRTTEPLHPAIVRMKAAVDLATATPSQVLAERLLARLHPAWSNELRTGLRARRDHLVGRLQQRLPAWTIEHVPTAGLSLWIRLPVSRADAFCHLASLHGVVVAPGTTACICGRHSHYIRLSFAHPIDVLDLAVDRLTSAWETHSENLAATPMETAAR